MGVRKDGMFIASHKASHDDFEYHLLIGKSFKIAMDGGIKREELFITSKVWNDMHGEGDVHNG